MDSARNIVGDLADNLSSSLLGFSHRLCNLINISDIETKELKKQIQEVHDMFCAWLHTVIDITSESEFKQLITKIQNNSNQYEFISLSEFLELLEYSKTIYNKKNQFSRILRLIKTFESILNSPPPKGGISFISFFYRQYLPTDHRQVRYLRGLFSLWSQNSLMS